MRSRPLFIVLFISLLALCVSCGKDDDGVTANKKNSDSSNVDQSQQDSTANNSEPKGDGSKENPFVVASSSDWVNLVRANATKNMFFSLAADIKIKNSSYVEKFNGVLYGNNHVVTTEGAPLFVVMDSATVRDVVMEGTLTAIPGYCYVDNFYGAVTSKADNGSLISNCISRVDFDMEDVGSKIAGICGHLRRGAVDSCGYCGKISNYWLWSAGITVHNDTFGVVRNCCLTGSIKGTGISVGGITYRNEGTIANCYVLSDITSNSEAAGIAVLCRGDKAIIDNCYYAGTIASATRNSLCCSVSLGGVAQYCYAYAKVTEEETAVALVGRAANRGTAENCYEMDTYLSLKQLGFYGTKVLVDELNARRNVMSGLSAWHVDGNRVVFGQ